MAKTYNLIVSIPYEAPAHYSLSARRVLIGRSPAHPVCIAANPVSSLHCELVLSDDGYTIADLGSRNGTRVNGASVDASPVLLRNGDQILFGETVSAQLLEIATVAEIADEGDDYDDEEPMINPVAAAVASATSKLSH